MSAELLYGRENCFLALCSRPPSSGVWVTHACKWNHTKRCIYSSSSWPWTRNLKLVLFLFLRRWNYFQKLFSEQSKSFKVSGEIFLHGQCRVFKWNCLQGDSRMFQLIPYLKSNVMKEDNHVRRGKSSGKDSRRMYVNQIKNKEKLFCVIGIFLKHIYICLCEQVHIYCR